MNNNPFPVPPQYDLVRGAEAPPPSSHPAYETRSNCNTIGVDVIGPILSTDHGLPPPQFTDDDDPPPPTGFADQYTYYRGNQTHGIGPPPLEVVQYGPIASRPPRLEHRPILGADIVPNNGPFSRPPCLPNVAGPPRGHSGRAHFGMSHAEDLKHLASQYLHNPGSHVDKLRMRRSRSGTFKVLILLEIDDPM